jgi:hypothetical protein
MAASITPGTTRLSIGIAVFLAEKTPEIGAAQEIGAAGVIG